MFQDISIEQLIELRRTKKLCLIDVRSPAEFVEFQIPGSTNIPLFNDEERKEVGTLYKQVSVKAAQDRGLEIVSQKLPRFIKQIEQLDGQKVVFCWRGGMRSKTTATLLDLMGIKVSRLLGGIRAYRRWVTHILEHPPSVPQCIVISGYTGTAKTQILRRLFEKGYPVLDLEQMAQHRGSIFGHIHLIPHNQKTFDALLVEHLIDHQYAPYLIIEAESRRIGKVVMPEFLCQAKQQGFVIHIDMPIEQRVNYILEDYRPTENHEAYIQAISHIKKRIHPSVATQIIDSITQQSYETAVQLLLEYYYDPRYHHASWKYQYDPIYCRVANANDAIEQIEHLISQRFPSNQ